MILINGVGTDHVAFNDRGLQYGDGLFETIAVKSGHPFFLNRHLQRLSTGCMALKLPVPDLAEIASEINWICKGSVQAVVKVMITRGVGGRGYRLPETVIPTRIISLYPFPEYPDSYAAEGINTRFCDTRLGLNPTLAGLKHLNRLEQVMARAEWDEANSNEFGIQEGIMLDLNNHVIEGVMTNLFYVKDDVLYTAALKFAGVAGIIRAIIMELAADKNIKLVEHDYGKEALLGADEAFVCNSIIGIWPIKQLENVYFEIGAMTKQFQHWLVQYKDEELECAEN